MITFSMDAIENCSIYLLVPSMKNNNSFNYREVYSFERFGTFYGQLESRLCTIESLAPKTFEIFSILKYARKVRLLCKALSNL